MAMRRITKAELDGAFGRFCRAAKSNGFDTDGWGYETGNKTYGVSYKLLTRTNDESYLNPRHYFELSGWGKNYLGMTAREAYDTLHTLIVALENVSYLRDRTLAEIGEQK